jgi:hypothetical protein
MNTLDLNSYHVSELLRSEQTEIEGGSFWSVLGNIIGGAAYIAFELLTLGLL